VVNRARGPEYNTGVLAEGMRFRVWIPLVAVLLVLLSIATLLSYVLPAARVRLGEFVESQAYTRAIAIANAAVDPEIDLRSELDLIAESGGGKALVVDSDGRVVARAGEGPPSPLPEEVLRKAARGVRLNDTIGEQRVAVVPVVREGNLEGGAVYVSGASEGIVNQIFLRSGIEAAAIASVLGGGLALLLATLLSRRVERLTAGARAMGGGNLSNRIEPGYGDELGELAHAFNGMADRLERSFTQLKETDATLNAILNNLAEGVLATDLSGKVMFVNLSARAMLGLGSEGPLGKLPDVWEDLDLPGAVARCAEERECGEARVRDGEDFFQVRLEQLPQFDEHKGGVLVVIRDLSEGRRLEANQQRFLANAAHELKTPISAIVGAAEILMTEERDDPETRRRFLGHISREADRLQRLSDTLLRLARSGYDLREPDVHVVDLDGMAREAAERIEPLAEGAGVLLRVEGQGGRVQADHEWLGQALLVVLGNAVRHSERGGSVLVRAEGAAVSVEDEGAGIGEEDLPLVFEPFYRGKDARKGEAGAEGFGLGLAICKDLVERMGGKISLESARGVGTKVRIELPEV
jgi:PAS domain S-box-containing protein